LCAGAGISRQPLPVVADMLKRGSLVALLPGYELPSPTLYAVYLPGRLATSIKTKELVKWLSAAFSRA
jgi:DNA-binding transcriptional LysR family regulator